MEKAYIDDKSHSMFGRLSVRRDLCKRYNNINGRKSIKKCPVNYASDVSFSV